MKHLKVLAFLIFTGIFAFPASAAVIYNDFDYINSEPDGDNDPVNLAAFASYDQVRLDIAARGDFGTGSTERLFFNINGHNVFAAGDVNGIQSLGNGQFARFVDSVISFNSVEIVAAQTYYMTMSLMLDVDAVVYDSNTFFHQINADEPGPYVPLTVGWSTPRNVDVDLNNYRSFIDVTLTGVVPEPSILLLFGTGLLGLALVRRRKQGSV